MQNFGESVFLDQEPPAVVLKVMIVVGKLRRRNKFSRYFFHLSFHPKLSEEFQPRKDLTGANVTLSQPNLLSQ